MTRHDELLKEGARTAPEPDTAHERSARLKRSRSRAAAVAIVAVLAGALHGWTGWYGVGALVIIVPAAILTRWLSDAEPSSDLDAQTPLGLATRFNLSDWRERSTRGGSSVGGVIEELERRPYD